MAKRPGLRERNKQRTREEIARAAHELFCRTRLQRNDPAEDRRSRRRLDADDLRLLPEQEDILFSNIDALTGALAQAIDSRPADEDALETVRKFILNGRPPETSDLESKLHSCVSSDPTLQSHLRARIAQVEEVLAPAIADDLGATTDDPRTQLVTTSLIAAFNLLANQGAAKTKRLTDEELAARLDPVFTFLRAGLDPLKEPRTRRRH